MYFSKYIYPHTSSQCGAIHIDVSSHGSVLSFLVLNCRVLSLSTSSKHLILYPLRLPYIFSHKIRTYFTDLFSLFLSTSSLFFNLLTSSLKRSQEEVAHFMRESCYTEWSWSTDTYGWWTLRISRELWRMRTHIYTHTHALVLQIRKIHTNINWGNFTFWHMWMITWMSCMIPQGLHPAVRLDSRSASRKYDYTDVIQRSPRFEPKSSGSTTTGGGGGGGMSAAGSTEDIDHRFTRIATKICETIERCEMRTAAQTRQDANQLEWKKIALVCDRFLFWVFTIVTTVCASLILFSSPYGPRFSMLYE